MRRLLVGGIAVAAIVGLAVFIIARTPRTGAGIATGAQPETPPGIEGLKIAPEAPTKAKPGQEYLIMYRGLPCFDCHNILTLDPTDTGILFSHNKHLKRGFHCGQCHGSGAHTKMIRPGHDQCFGCHDGKTAPNRCVYCHARTADIKPKTHTANYIQTHGKQVLKTKGYQECHKCHDNTWCTECHGLIMPHPKYWADDEYSVDKAGNRIKTHSAGHGPPAEKDESICYRCHMPEQCQQCHRTPMPHRTDYIRQHPVTMSQKQEVCSNCHTSRFCEDCHTRERDIVHTPGVWIKQHPAAAKKNEDQCLVCHTKEYCDKCHTTKNPHGEDFLDLHKIYARTDPFVCNRCHTNEFCTTCHEVPHPTGWGEWHKQAGISERAVCLTCHKSGFCDDCHGLPMPHPQDFAYTHKDQKGVSFAANSLCMKCHDKETFCYTCHDKQ
jgi:hypothetical protein